MTTLIIIILGILVVILGFTTFNLLRKSEKLEDIILQYDNYISEFTLHPLLESRFFIFSKSLES